MCPFPRFFTLIAANRLPKSTNQVRRFYHMTFQNGGHDHGKLAWTLSGNEIEVPNRRDRRKKSPSQWRNDQSMASVAKFARDFRCRSNSLRSACKIARCVGGFSKLRRQRQRERGKTKRFNEQNNGPARAL